jgi:hypothetical protein
MASSLRQSFPTRKYTAPMQIRLTVSLQKRLEEIAKRNELRLVDVIRLMLSNALSEAERHGLILNSSPNGKVETHNR